MGWRTWLGAGLGAALLTACQTEEESPLDLDDVAAATVTLEPGHCAGVVVEDGRHALTAAHCLRTEDRRVHLSFLDGRRLGASAVHVDRGRDVAILRLDAPAPVRPLEVAQALPTPGAPLVFAGRNDRPGEPQEALLERLGPCPSLPEVPAALFTTIRGKPGDSGAPLVDARMRVVGLVHGGAACRIAAPTAGLGEVVAQLSRGGPALARKAPPSRRQAALPSADPGAIASGRLRSEVEANGATSRPPDPRRRHHGRQEGQGPTGRAAQGHWR
ncbi:S1 family peptidase [Corallococcus macrosporus]|uniref:Trypsin domain-containing protein n=1 Tax=Myxococcus fulvus (strain ATCC BAA-855 / HW-1) TaxID=483219 RepID=F8CMJ5_MYXFH|nr:serine protease [Corallococcus macrosporus]AEI65274.1 trypsin domain-containing protein [Corallococcus macrosporus]